MRLPIFAAVPEWLKERTANPLCSRSIRDRCSNISPGDMMQIQSEEEYEKAISELEDLLFPQKILNDNNEEQIKALIDAIEEYEELHYPI